MTANEPPTSARKAAALFGAIGDLGRPRKPDYTPEPVISIGDLSVLKQRTASALEAKIDGLSTHHPRPVEVDPEVMTRLLESYEAFVEFAVDQDAFWCVPGEHYVPGEEEFPVELGALRTCRECMEAGQ